ncbi:MAG TPA: fumarate reductase subunit FrdD [Rhodothermia bacterium]
MSKPSKASNEPFWWALFGAGGVVSALFVPVLIVLFGLAIPLGWVEAPDYQSMRALLDSPVTRLLLFGIIALCLFHWAHRFRFTLYDGLQLKHLESLILILTYGSAIVTVIFAGITIWTL